jgi:hypothetical protein
MKRQTSLAVLFVALLYASSAHAGVWFEFLYAPCLIGDKDNPRGNGEIPGSVDCFNDDFNGDPSRTLLSIKAFQPWEYGFMFLYYDVTGPFNNPSENIPLNEKGGFFGGTTVGLSAKKIGQKITGTEFDWGMLADVSLKYEIEHVAKFGALHYVGLQWDLIVPHMDFVSVTTVMREDRSLSGVDLQLGAAWQKSFSLGSLDFIFGGFFQWGVFGEGNGNQIIVIEAPAGEGGLLEIPAEGRPFFLSQPQLLWDVGKLIQFTPAKLYLGLEYQLAFNRYLIPDKTENVLQYMIRWNI